MGIVRLFLAQGENAIHSAVGCQMIRNEAFFFFPTLSLVVLFLTSCSGPFQGVCTTNCGGGGATVSVTLVADTLPANPSILSFKVSVNGVQLTPTTGTAVTLTPATPVIDLMRLQSDTAFLGTLANVPSGTYTVQVSLSNPTITFLNDTGSSVTAGSTTCANSSVCTATLTAAGNPTISAFTLTATSSGKQGIGLDFNLKNAISLSGGTLSVNFNPSAPSPAVLSAFTLPRSNANLGSNQLELIEDFTGVVSLNGSNVKVTSPTRGALTATNTSSSFFDLSPDGSICPSPGNFASCVVNGQIASVDAYLNSDGTISLKEYEPLVATQKDLVEGTVYSIPSPTQFGLVVTDKIQAASGSLINGLNTGALLTVNISSSANSFFVDTKGLAVSSVAPGILANFAGQTSTSAIHDGQSIAVHVTAFTAASGSTPASATADTVTLRWSRITSSVQSASSPVFTISGTPSYFGFAQGSLFGVQTFNGTPGADGITNFDGVADGNGLAPTTPPVALRALFLENTSNSANPVFFAAKIRQH